MTAKNDHASPPSGQSLTGDAQAGPCQFDEAWRGKCGKPSVRGHMCAEHADARCVSCGDEADHSCDFTGTQFVCGAPLCPRCEPHVEPGEGGGYFNMHHRHRRIGGAS